MTRTPTMLAITAMALFGPADGAFAQVATNPWTTPAAPPAATGGNPFSGRSAYAAPQYATPYYGAPAPAAPNPAYPPADNGQAATAYGQQTYPAQPYSGQVYSGQPYASAPGYGTTPYSAVPAYPTPYAVPDYRPDAGTTGQQATTGDPALSGYGTGNAYGAPLTGTFGNPYSSLYPGTGALAGLGYGIPLTGGYLPGLGLAAPGGWQSPGYYASPYSGSLAPFYTPYATGLPGLGGLGPYGM
ncbi:hypothetical protein [Rhodobium gokarnense]|uniref:Uncharacterized protein n=1 Tax=Rhodobium gokarnense TaxID=364296 RepID=A0ABT3H8X0_9HYPH|nr:hypothetical protein [Rhodobium gokarnense]MCW2306847.1 hypothetical protein [Rhodobium gokarnense]